jgi:hypothetical protein
MTRKLGLGVFLSGVVLACALATGAGAESILDFTLINKTGYGIAELYVAPSASSDWGENLLDDALENNEAVTIKFSPKAARVAKWDLMITWVDGGDRVYWRGYQLADISKITLRYNRATEETTAVTE